MKEKFSTNSILKSLRNGHKVEIQVKGVGMSPFLKHGQTILLKRVKKITALAPGDVIAYQLNSELFTIQRVKRRVSINSKLSLVMKGDSAPYQEQTVFFEQIVGKVTANGSRCSGEYGAIVNGTYTHFEDLFLFWSCPILCDIATNILNTINMETLDWEYLLNKCGWHGVSAMLYQKIKDSGAVPNETQKKFHDILEVEKQWLEYARFQLRRYLKLFRQAGLEFILFKGPVFSKLLYDKPVYRPYHDVDLVVRPTDFWLLKDVLEKCYIMPPLTFDIHTNFGATGNRDCRIPLFDGSLEPVFDSAMDFRFDDIPILIPAITFQLLYSCVHLAAHIEVGEYKLKWLIDIFYLCKQFTSKDWDQFYELCKKNKLEHLVSDILTFAKDWMGASVPSEAVQVLGKHRPDVFELKVFELL